MSKETVLYSVSPQTTAMAVRRGSKVFTDALISRDRNLEGNGLDLEMAVASVYLQGAQDMAQAYGLISSKLILMEGAGI